MTERDRNTLKDLQTWLAHKLIDAAAEPESTTVKSWIDALAPFIHKDEPSLADGTPIPGKWPPMRLATNDPNHDLVPTLRMFDGLMMNRAADEIERWRSAYWNVVTVPARRLLVVGQGLGKYFNVTSQPLCIDGVLQVHTDDASLIDLPAPEGG